jgi:hypothetical protein
LLVYLQGRTFQLVGSALDSIATLLWCCAWQVNKNATSMANRFKSLGGLKLLLSQELSAINKHQAACLDTLRQLQGAVGGSEGPDEVLIEQAGQCGRCRWEAKAHIQQVMPSHPGCDRCTAQ